MQQDKSLGPKNWFLRLIWPVSHYIITHVAVSAAYLVFTFLNRTTALGRENIQGKKNILLLSNHQSMIDSFLVGTFAFYPKTLIKPSLIPWNPAAEENFYSNPVLGWFSSNWKCIPIKKGRKDVGAIFRMATALRNGTMTLFPEGTRTRDGSIGKARGGAGLLILENQPTVIPVCIDGMNKMLPIGSIAPRLFQRIYVSYGKPMDLSSFYSQEKSREVSGKVMEAVMDRIREMQGEINALKEREANAVTSKIKV